VAAAVGVLALLVVPARSANAAAGDALQSLAADVESLHGSKDIAGPGQVEALREQQSLWEAERDKVRQQMRQHGLPTPVFRDTAHPDVVPDPGVWKLLHKEKVAELRAAMASGFRVVGDKAVTLQDYTGSPEWVPEDAMREEEKKYWVQRHLVELLAATNSSPDDPCVYALDSIKFVQQAEHFMHPAHVKVLKPIAFELTIDTTYPKLLRVIYQLLKSEADIHVTGLSMQRSSRAGPRRAADSPAARSATSAGGQKGAMPENLLTVVVRAYMAESA
jgi:hypothetical protein